jgi:hypothetical protein
MTTPTLRRHREPDAAGPDTQVGSAGETTTRRRPRSAATAVVALLAVVFALVAAPSASAEQSIPSYAVAYTGGIGVYLRSAPNDDPSSRVVGVPDGTLIPVECETVGTPRTNSYGQTSDIYARSPGGVYVATIYLNNGVLGRSNAPDCGAFDAARAAATQPTTVAALLKAGQRVVYTQDGPDRIRAYYSHSETAFMANRLAALSNISDSLSTYGCAAAGVMLTGLTAGAGAAVGLAVGTFGGIGCDLLTNNQVTSVAGIAQSANHFGKCLELRMHRDGDRWVADDNGWTMTDYPDYCS